MIDPISSNTSAIGGSYSPPSLSRSQNELVQSVLSRFDAESLSESDIQAINDTFQDAGIVPSRDLRETIEAAGFDAEELKPQRGSRAAGGPPPPPPQETEEEQLNALLNILEEYDGQTLNQNDITNIQQKWQEAGYAAAGNFISITA